MGFLTRKAFSLIGVVSGTYIFGGENATHRRCICKVPNILYETFVFSRFYNSCVARHTQLYASAESFAKMRKYFLQKVKNVALTYNFNIEIG